MSGLGIRARIFLENGNKLRTVVVPDGLLSVEPSVGKTFALLRFVDEPIIIEAKENPEHK